jgi:CheY-like chemotaxis protein
MPDINGLTLAQAMDHIPSLNGVPVIMITSRLTDPSHLAPRQHGQTFSLNKPYRELDLIELLDALPVENRNP